MSRGQYSTGIDQSTNFFLAVGSDNVPNIDHLPMQGIGPASIIPADPLLVNPIGLTVPVFPNDSGEALVLRSDNAADIGQTISVIGLDENFEYKLEFITLNGTTVVPTPGLWTRVNVTQYVSGTTLLGTVTVENAGLTTVFSGFLAEHNISHIACASTPVNTRTQLPDLFSSMIRPTGNQDDHSTVYVYIRAIFQEAFTLAFIQTLNRRGSTAVQFFSTVPNAVDGVLDIYVTSEASAAADTIVRLPLIIQDA